MNEGGLDGLIQRMTAQKDIGNFVWQTDEFIVNRHMLRAYKDLDSAQKVKGFILAELVENEDPYFLIDSKYGMWGDGFPGLYKTLVGIANLGGVEKQKLKPVLDRISFFEEAAIEIILDRGIYFTKTRSGNKGTASEFVGMMVNIPMRNSPLAKDGRYIDRVMQAIKYEDIVKGRLNPEDGQTVGFKIAPKDMQTVGYQIDLLQLLHTVQTPDKPGREYWHKLQRNPAFIDLCYQVAVWDKDPETDNLLCQILKRDWQAANGDMKKFEGSIWWYIARRFDDETARDKFLAEPANEYKEVMSNELARLRVDHPSMRVYLPGPRIVVMTNYARDGDKAAIGYAEINGAINGNGDFNISRKNITLDMKAMKAPGVPEDAGKALLDMTTKLENFMSAYETYHNAVKAKK